MTAMDSTRYPTPENPADRPARYTEELHADLVVVGGGLAGLCMALAAAREGADTVLVHDRPVLGGNSSSEVRVVPAGTAHFSAWARETGIVEELLLEDRATNHAQFWEGGLTNCGWDLTLWNAVRQQPRLRTVLNASVRTVHVEDTDADGGGSAGRGITISRVDAVQLTTEKELRLRARQFADCTGNGTVGYLAGADWDYGREARHEYGEPLAPAVRDFSTSGSTITLRARDTGRPVLYTPPPWAEPYDAQHPIGPFRELRNIHRKEFGGFWWLEIGYPFHQVTGAEEVRDELLRHALGVWNYLKNHHPRRRAMANYALEWIGSLPGRRESRRLLGDVVLSEWDCHKDGLWPDRIASVGWYLDLHAKGGLLNKSEPGEPSKADTDYRHWTRVPPFSVPLRACYSRNVTNLWLGGRCLSATHVALGALRVQQILGMLGQATGIAAAYALVGGLTPQQTADPDDKHIDRVQQRLLRSDVRIHGMRERPVTGLEVEATADSQAPLDFGAPDPAQARRLHVPRALVFPVSTGRLRTAAVRLRNDGRTTATIGWHLAEVPTLWTRTDGEPVAHGTVDVPPGTAEVTLPLEAVVRPGRLHRLSLSPLAGEAAPDAAAVHWITATDQPPGTTAQYLHTTDGGPTAEAHSYGVPAAGEIALPAYRHWCQDKWTALMLRTDPVQYPYGPENVVTGRHWPETGPQLWMSDPQASLPQSLQLSYPRPLTFDEVRLRFDTDLNARISSAPGLWRPPQCVSAYRVLSRPGPHQPWRELHRAEDNYHRLNVIRLPGAVRARQVRVEVLAVGPPEPRRFTEEETACWREDGRRAARSTRPPGCRIYSVGLYHEDALL
ncbi:FAD-dependent oxidoreductase [Streptomyces noursei]|uniref:FAD-dependent oxidoreductase n=1 Tax=Streptomyces noursei TaxID=1971 RepID=UPI001672DC27|nr:FAD-dependent oxidoreductase [Streptomyces noursei]MCZ1019510.1 FAD-dependent oxidoreductase [Streptomyces noursei]GGX09097.1 hypothetical protein GCM10010341_33440 [Streptomyces noursei]